MTHAAMLSGKYKRFIINDIAPMITQLFCDAVAGKYRDEKRWISREDFEKYKDVDPYVRYCWSFGNEGNDYMYAPEVERFKKWLHCIFFAETPKEARLYWKKFIAEFKAVKDDVDRLTQEVGNLCNDYGVELMRKPDGTVDAEKIKRDVFSVLSADMREYLRDALKKSGHTAADVDRLLGTKRMACHYFGKSEWSLPTEAAYEKMKTIMPDLTIPWLVLHERLESLQSLERYSLDYQEVKIPDGAVIYCDIPYKGVSGYQKDGFDHERFYAWAKGKKNIYVSEYHMPEDFECILEIDTMTHLNGKCPAERTERLWRNRETNRFKGDN